MNKYNLWNVYMYINGKGDSKMHEEVGNMRFGDMDDIFMFTPNIKIDLLHRYFCTENIDVRLHYSPQDMLCITDIDSGLSFRFTNGSRAIVEFETNGISLPGNISKRMSIYMGFFTFAQIKFYILEVFRLYKRHNDLSLEVFDEAERTVHNFFGTSIDINIVSSEPQFG